MVRPAKKGAHYERELAQLLYRFGFAVIRGPASGSKVKRVIYPDIVAIRDGQVFALEVKTIKKDFLKKRSVYIPRHQIEKIKEFAKRSGGRAFIAVKIIGEAVWKIIPINLLKKASEDYFKVDEEVLSKGVFVGNLTTIASKENELTNKILLDLAKNVYEKLLKLEITEAKLESRTIRSQNEVDVKKYLVLTAKGSASQVLQASLNNSEDLKKIGIPVLIDWTGEADLPPEKIGEYIGKIAAKTNMFIFSEEEFNSRDLAIQ